jgi:hypothetical protein
MYKNDKMRRLITIITLMLLSNYGYTQARVGYTLTEISTEFSDDNLFSGFPSNPFISVITISAKTFYVFNENNICTDCMVMPLDNIDLQFYINKYNNNYKALSDTSWVQVNDGFNVYIDLLIDEKGNPFFHWRM